MIGREDDDDVVASHAIGESLQEPREVMIEPQDLIVNLPRVGAERVAHCIGGGQTHRQNVGAFAAQFQRLEALEREQQRQRVHGGHARDRCGRKDAVGGQRVRKDDARAAILPHFVVRFFVRAVRE